MAAEQQKPQQENVVYIGKKPIMNYVLAVITQFNNNASEVAIRARGKMISRAVDVAEIIRNRFIPDVKIKNISIGTETLKSPDGKTVNISSIEIVLSRG